MRALKHRSMLLVKTLVSHRNDSKSRCLASAPPPFFLTNRSSGPIRAGLFASGHAQVQRSCSRSSFDRACSNQTESIPSSKEAKVCETNERTRLSSGSFPSKLEWTELENAALCSLILTMFKHEALLGWSCVSYKPLCVCVCVGG